MKAGRKIFVCTLISEKHRNTQNFQYNSTKYPFTIETFFLFYEKCNTGALDDLWTLDTRNFEWTKVNTRSTPLSTPATRPSPRYRHTASLVPNTSSIIFTGGWKKSGMLVGNDYQPCFVYDTISGIWTVISLLNSSRAGHASSSISINNGDRLGCCVLLSGGEISDANDKEECQRILTNQIFLLKWECSLSPV